MWSKRRSSCLTSILILVVGLGSASAADVRNVGGATGDRPAPASRTREDAGRSAKGSEAGGQVGGRADAGSSSAGSSASGSATVGPRRETVPVLIDHAKVIRLPERTHTVIVGNPIIADVTVQRNGILVVTGKSYGVTNLIALDGAGTMLAESLVSVQAPQDSVVMVQRGFDRESYSCTPNCQPSILLGDSARYFGEVGGQATQRNTLATQR
jgi:hypothetical protein